MWARTPRVVHAYGLFVGSDDTKGLAKVHARERIDEVGREVVPHLAAIQPAGGWNPVL